MSTVDQRVKEIVMQQLGVKAEEASPEASFVDDLGADSLILLNWLWHLKKHLAWKFLMRMLRKLLPFNKQLIM